VAADRVSGKKPSPVRAAIAALAAGAAASAVTYRVMRH
jgi:hypothetical protein